MTDLPENMTGADWCDICNLEVIPKDVALAMVAAHGERCTKAADECFTEREAAGVWVYGSDVAASIEALTTADAKAALDKLIKEAREEGFWIGRQTGGSKAEIDAALKKIREGDDG